MFGKKIIPCVKVINGKTAEGPVYCGKRGAGDPVGCAAAYARAGADGVMFLDVSARGEGVAEVVRRAAAELDVPIAAGCAGSPRELRELRELCDRHGVSPLIEVDGGVSLSNARALAAAGADVLVAGSAIFKAPQPAAVIRDMRELASIGRTSRKD